MADLKDEDWRRCVFVAVYERINDTTFRRAEKDIEVADEPWAAEFEQPVITEIAGEVGRRMRVEARVLDRRAVNLKSPDLLGDYSGAAEQCNRAVETRYRATIVASISAW
jgi:hypothetical protein